MPYSNSIKRRMILILLTCIILLTPLVLSQESGIIDDLISNLNPFAVVKLYDKEVKSDTSEYLKSDYNIQYGSIKLSKTIFLIPTDKIAEYTLIRNTEYCLTHCEAEGKVTLYSDEKLFDNIKFNNLDGSSTNIKSSEYYIFDGYLDNYVDVPDTYIEECIDLKLNVTNNKTKECYQVVNTTKKVNQPIENWIKYSDDILKAGDYRWKIKGIKDVKQSVDFIPIINNIEFNEWATWNSSLNVQLRSYWKLNETTGTLAVESVFGNNGTLTGGNNWTTDGKIAGAISFNGSTNVGFKSVNNGSITGTMIRSYGAWIKSYDVARGIQSIIGQGNWDPWPFALTTDVGKFRLFQSGAKDLYTKSKLLNNTWYFVVLTMNATNFSIYINGTLDNSTGTTGWVGTIGTQEYWVGKRNYDNGYNFKGIIDEVFVYNRTLSAQEISDLYHDGVGLTYSPDAGESDNVYPVFSNNKTSIANGSEYNPNNNYQFNITIENTNGTTGIEFNGTNYTLSNTTSSFYKTFNSLSAGIYSYYFWSFGNGTTNLFNKSNTYSYTIIKNSSLVLGLTATTPITYPTTTNFAGSNCPTQLTCSLNISNAVYKVGTISANYSTIGNINYTANSKTFTVTINQNTSNCNIIFNTTSPQTYLTKFRVYSNCSSEFYITRNGLIIANNSEQDLSAGTYNFTVFRNDSQNYSNIIDQKNFTINKATTSLALSITPSNNVFNGTQTTATGTGCPTQLTCNLYNNGTVVANPDINTYLVSGTFVYIYNTTGNINYTSASVTDTLIVTLSSPTTTVTIAQPKCLEDRFVYRNKKVPVLNKNC